MKLIFSHPTGNQNVRAAAKGLLDAGLLNAFYTSFAVFPGNYLYSIGNLKLFSEIKKRSFDQRLQVVTHTWPFLELGRMLASKVRFKHLTKNESGILSVDAVYRSLDKRVASALKNAAIQGLDAVYAYEDGAINTFIEAKKYGIQCLYDLPIGYWRTARLLLKEEHERWPDWANTLTGFQDSDEKLKRKDQELILADRIVVASSFTARSLTNFPGKLAPVEVIPYGFPPVAAERHYSDLQKRPLKLLFVGGLSQRKGLADLFAAVKNIGKHVELTVVGKKMNTNCQALDHSLKQHKWIPGLPHTEILKLMQTHDVLVFPSLFEGFGLVITEAMSQGVPVITTDRTIGPDIITDAANGWIIQAGSTVALQEAIEKLIGQTELVASAGIAAMETAKSRSWDTYGHELSETILKNYMSLNTSGIINESK